MANFEPPSFSLGLDLDFDFDVPTTLREDFRPQQARQSSTATALPTIEEDDNDFQSPMVGSDPQVSDPPRSYKRLRRGSTSQPTPAVRKRESVESCKVDDDIEEFSSQEDRHRDEPAATQYHSMHSTSKFPLRGLGVLTTEPASQRKKTTKKHVSDPQVSANMEASSNKMMFPKLTVSPLRRFQLIDSDSDSDSGDPCVSEGANRGTNKLDSSLKERPSSNSGQRAAAAEQWKTKESVSMSCTEDLWKDFCSEKGFHIPTPALDEVCEEYFRSVKDKNVAQNSNKGCHENSNVSKNDEQQWDVGNASVHRYFFHDDPRIQKLVRSRLPNFFPVGAVNNRGYKQPDASVIDYMGQFSDGEGSKQADGKHNSEVGSRRSRKNSKKSKAEELPQGSGGWMNPKHCTEIPKDAGKRRVQAVGQSAGHWYIGPDGKRVYVNKNGQELTGQIAYRHYRKESGAGFKRSKKKTASKKKRK